MTFMCWWSLFKVAKDTIHLSGVLVDERGQRARRVA